MNNKRMQQLIFMFSSITGESEKVSADIIMETKTGKSVMDGDKSVLYEQQTENLYSIAMELSQLDRYKEVAQKLSNQNIIKAMKQLRSIEQEKKKNIDEETLTASRLGTKTINEAKNRLLEKQREVLKIQKRNQLNARRIEYADKFKR